MTAWEIAGIVFVAAAIKGVLLSTAYKRGWIRSPEQVGKDRMEEKAVLRAYREWRKNPRSGKSSEPRVINKLIPGPDSSSRTPRKNINH
jgi:hypothetical protein